MAQRDKETYDSYDKDAFDTPPRGPVGVHRGARSVGARMMPAIVVLLVAALCGFGAWVAVSGNGLWKSSQATSSADTSDTASASDTAQSKAQKKSDSSATDQAGQSDDTQQTGGDQSKSSDAATAGGQQAAAESASTVNKATQVTVVNATGVQGYAAQQSDVLQAAGYTSVTPANPSGTVPTASVVWYENEADKATAQDVATTLGIASVEQTTGLSTPITVMLLG